jgi:hypothetical protein
MKKWNLLLFVAGICLFLASSVYAEEETFLGAPVVKSKKIIDKTDKRLELVSEYNHDETLSYYKKVLKDEENIKYRNWKEDTYIEDDGARKWHSITISKLNDKDGANVTIVEDSWTWIIGTLILRYIGVFVVLLVLLLGMTISGTIISRSVGKEAKK